LPATIKHNYPIALRSSLSRPRNPLLNDLTAKVGIDLPPFGPRHSLAKQHI
jgi:hypothetical protein